MRTPIVTRTVIVGLIVTLAGIPMTHAGNRGRTVDAKKIEKITTAMPAKAPAIPKKPRTVLVYSKCSGFYHGSIPTGNKCMEIMGEKTGAFKAVVSDDPANFEADKLAEFDAIVLVSTTGELLQKDLPPERSEKLRANLMAWLKSGKGLVGIHAATDSSYKWKEYGEMIGGFFSGHPWHMLVQIKNDDPGNPLNAAFNGKGFEVTDEIYQFARGVYDRHKQRTLLSLDMSKVQNRGKRPDQDYAISWVKKHGEGRVFYCSLGHQDDIYWNPAVLQHYLAGIQWACGDLEGVDITPNPLP